MISKDLQEFHPDPVVPLLLSYQEVQVVQLVLALQEYLFLLSVQYYRVSRVVLAHQYLHLFQQLLEYLVPLVVPNKQEITVYVSTVPCETYLEACRARDSWWTSFTVNAWRSGWSGRSGWSIFSCITSWARWTLGTWFSVFSSFTL